MYPYLYRGKVLSNDDPLNLGRCKILVPSIYGSDNKITTRMLPWSRPVVYSSTNESSGSYCIPEVNDIVWVMFEGGDVESPVYLGGTIGSGDISVDKNNCVIYTKEGDSVLYDKLNHKFIITVGSSKIEASRESGIRISSDSPIILDSDVTITGKLNAGSINTSSLNTGSCNLQCICSHE